MSEPDDEFAAMIRNYHCLTPGQQIEFQRLAIERAKAMRADAIRSLFRSLWLWFKRRAAVARLRELDDRALKDIGLHRSEIEAAVRGPDRLRRGCISRAAPLAACRPARLSGRDRNPADDSC